MIDDSDILELRILELLETEEKWWTLEELGNMLQISKATVQKYLSILKTRIDRYPDTVISIETSTSKGIYFHRDVSFNIQVFYTDVLKELLIFKILDSFIYNEDVPVVKVSLDHYVSVASVRRKYKAINTYFDGLGLEIKREKLQGDERQIRWFYASLYWEIFKGVDWPFLLIPKAFVTQLLERVQKFFDMELVPETREEMMFWITVNGLRHIKGYRVPEDLEIHKYVQNNPLFPQFMEIMRQVFPHEAKNKDPKGLGEMEYLFLLISALPVLEKSKEYNQMIYQAHKSGKTKMYAMTQDWLELYQSVFGKHFENKLDLEHQLLRLHSFAYLYHMERPLFFRKSYVDEIVSYHPNFLKKMKQIYEEMAQKYTEIARNEVYLLEHYVLLVLGESDINQFEQTVRIGLSFSKGIIYEQVVKEKIESYFKGHYKLDFVDADDPKEILVTDLGFLFEHETQVVSVSTRLTPRDYANIEQTLLQFI